uniref:Uncharacterized protein n=1 Tax=Opuntia streptacantha TaxID=393608 RepID=A0A7C9DQU5_OPUST
MMVGQISVPYFLNQVRLESCMYVGVTNFFRPLKVCLIALMMVMVDNRLRCSALNNVIVKCKLVVIPLVLNNHVMEYHTCSHYNTDFFFFQKTSGTTDNGKSSL